MDLWLRCTTMSPAFDGSSKAVACHIHPQLILLALRECAAHGRCHDRVCRWIHLQHARGG